MSRLVNARAHRTYGEQGERVTSSRKRRRSSSRCWGEPLERRVLLAAAAVSAELLEGAPAVLNGSATHVHPAPLQGSILEAVPIPSEQESVVNGVVYSNMGPGTSGYAAFTASTGPLGFDDYDSINDANINLTQFKFVGGVQNANGTLTFEFYNSAQVFLTSVSISFPNVGNFTYTLTPGPGVTIPDTGLMQVRANPGTTGQFLLSNAAPTVGTQDPNVGGSPPIFNHKFELTNTSGPVANANLAPALFTGWNDPIIISTTSGNNTDAGAILNGNTIFADYGFANFGTGAAGAFTATLELDGAVVNTQNVASLSSGFGVPVQDVNLGAVGPGVHTLEMTIDTGGTVAETNENDNTFTRQFFVATTLNGEIHGTKWNDVNGDGVKQGGEPGLAGWTMYIDNNLNNVFDAGEPSDVTDASGNYDLLNVPNGVRVVREVFQGGWTQTFPGPAGASNHDFKVTVDFLGGLSPTQQAAFTSAANRWAQIITGDLPDLFNVGFFVDDVRISASGVPIDGVSGILGQAGPSVLRAGSFLPARGQMQFDTADLADMEAGGSLTDVILHEMGHVLGIGTIWQAKGLLSGAGGADPRFTGASATAEYNTIFGSSLTSVPVENSGGAGTRDSHWRETTFQTELMTGFLSGAVRPLSRITAGSLQDLGYQVNLAASDPYVAPGPPAIQQPTNLLNGYFVGLDREPTIVGDGRIADVAGIASPNSHEVHVDAGESVANINFGNQATDAIAPTADVVDVAPDPRGSAVGLVTINFSESVSNVDLADFSLTRDGVAASMAGVIFNQVNPAQYTLNLSAATTRAGAYVLTLNAAGSGIVDGSANPLAGNASDSWIMNAINGTGAGDTIKLKRTASPGAIEVFVNNATATPDYTVSIAGLGANALNVLGSGGDDVLTLDFVNGAFSPTGGITFDGGASAAGDALILQGTGATETAAFNTTHFSFGATQIGYSATEKFRYDGGAGGDTLNVSAGTFGFDQDAAATSTALDVNVAAGATANFNATQHLDALSVSGLAHLSAGGAKALVATSLEVPGTGKLDLHDNDLIVNYSSTSPIGTFTGGVYTGISGLIDTGRGSAGNALWDGPGGIVTSDTRAINTSNRTSLGIAEAAQVLGLVGTATASFSGETVDATAVLVKFSWGGDANLDGKINIDDYGRIDGNVGASGSVFGWYFGDFNYDGKINIDDYGVIDGTIGQQGGVVL